MRRGTTPELQIAVNGVEVGKLTKMYLTLKQNNYEITITEDDIGIDEADNLIKIPLTQEQTLGFKDGYVNIQLRAMVDDSAIASDIKSVPIEHILMDGEIG